MISSKKLAANRINARASTGPKTAFGKARASRNAYRHGLSLPVLEDPEFRNHVGEMLSQIVSSHENLECHHCARRVAEAQVDLNRIRLARDGALGRAYTDANYASPSTDLSVAELQWITKNSNADVLPPRIARALDLCPEGDAKLLLIITDLSKTLRGLDRYERRALSRRKFAVRELDAARIRQNARFGNERLQNNQFEELGLVNS